MEGFIARVFVRLLFCEFLWFRISVDVNVDDDDGF